VPRTITISIDSSRTDALVADLAVADGVLTLHRQDGVSLRPPGDVVTVEVLDRRSSELFALLSRHGAGVEPGVSVTTSEPDGMVSASHAESIGSDISSSSFEEMEFILDREASMGSNQLPVMAVAGAVAAVGLITNSVHLVIGAMVIAPGFVPLLKLSLSATVGGTAWRRGLWQTAAGYGLLIIGAVVASVVLRATGTELPAGSGGYLAEDALVTYWRELTAAGTIVAVVAAVAGALVVVTNRAVLTAGVMIALALVPGATLAGLGAVSGDADLALDGGVRWAHDAAITVAVGAVVFGWLRARRRRALHGAA
jgi:uncharacterized protein (TIGR03382 family)